MLATGKTQTWESVYFSEINSSPLLRNSHYSIRRYSACRFDKYIEARTPFIHFKLEKALNGARQVHQMLAFVHSAH